MNQLLTDQSLKEFAEMVELPAEKEKEYLSILPKLNEDGRILLFDTLTEYYIIGSEEKQAEKALDFFREFAKDSDYDKLTKSLNEIKDKL